MRFFRGLLALVALGGAFLSVREYVGYRAVRAETIGRLDQLAIAGRRPDLVDRVWREPDPDHAGLVAARGILSDAFDVAWIGQLDREAQAVELERRRQRLEAAVELARPALRRLPVAYQAPMVLGGATFLLRAGRGDPRLYAEAEAWEAPLRLAMRMAPGHPEAARLLTIAKLEIWYALSDQERAMVRDRLAETFAAEPDEFQRLVDGWLSTAGTWEEAISVVPDDPVHWKLLQSALARREDHRHARGGTPDLVPARPRSLPGMAGRSRPVAARFGCRGPVGLPGRPWTSCRPIGTTSSCCRRLFSPVPQARLVVRRP